MGPADLQETHLRTNLQPPTRLEPKALAYLSLLLGLVRSLSGTNDRKSTRWLTYRGPEVQLRSSALLSLLLSLLYLPALASFSGGELGKLSAYDGTL